jgi:hypothetical protein
LGSRSRQSQGALLLLFYLVEIRHRQLIQSQSCTRSPVSVLRKVQCEYGNYMIICFSTTAESCRPQFRFLSDNVPYGKFTPLQSEARQPFNLLGAAKWRKMDYEKFTLCGCMNLFRLVTARFRSGCVALDLAAAVLDSPERHILRCSG